MAAPAPTSAASSSSSYEFEWGPSPTTSSAGSPSRTVPDLSPPLIAMVAVVGTAFLIVLYVRVLSRYLRRLCRRWHRWRCRRRLFRSTAAAADYDPEFSPPPGGLGVVSFGSSSEYFFSPYYGLDESTIKALPLSLFSRSKAKQLAATNRECAVCLLEFEDDDSIRTLPLCSHAFHVDCIDVWLRSHATCPLCRSAVLRHHDAASPFVPMRAARIRPSFDDLLLDPMPDPGGVAADPESEIAPAAPSPVRTDDRYGPRDFLLKRSYSFGFERSLAADRLVMEASTVSPWRYRHRGLWSKRWPSPFGGVGGMGSSSASRASRVFSFRSSRGGGGGGAAAGKSPFFRRRGFFPLSSESIGRFVGGGAGPSWRRSRSMTSPSAFFMRPLSATVAASAPAVNVGFSSSRMRCGDPEALLSPERLNRR